MALIENLDDLLDVNVPAPNDGDILYWDDAAGLWQAKAPSAGGGTIERQIRVSTDDIQIHWTGANWVASPTGDAWWVGYYSSTYIKLGGAGRFLNIYIPQGATITHAYLKPTARSNDASTEVKSRIHAEKDVAPATFSTYADYAARSRTTAVVDWDDIPSWVLGTLYQSPDIKTVFRRLSQCQLG